jgi:hypothetical protein
MEPEITLRCNYNRYELERQARKKQDYINRTTEYTIESFDYRVK